MKIAFSLKRALRSFNLPTLSLLALLQRTPAVQMVTTAGEFVMSSPIGTVLKSFAAIAASLGAMNSLAGATPLVASPAPATGTSATVGAAVSVAFTVNGTQTPPQSWQVSGSFAPGLNFSGLTSDGTVNVQNLQLTGTPTAAGTYMVNIIAFEFASGQGIQSPTYSYTVTVSGGSGTAPSFSTQPQSQTVTVGANVTLTVAVSGSPTPTLQWKKGSATLSGQTGTSLTLNNVQTTDAGSYTAVATNSAGTATSNAATLTVNQPATAPSFTTQPQSQTAAAGGSVTFTVAVSGNPAPTLQWQKGSTALSGQTGTSLTLSNVQTADAGSYSAVATNSAGTATSSSATLTVNPPVPNTPASAGAYASGATEVTLTWQPPAGGATVTGYKIDRAMDSAFGTGLTTVTLPTTSTSYVDTTVAAGTSYFYRISATNAGGASAPSSTLAVQTPASVGTGGTQFVNIASRAFCGTGSKVAIGGFVVNGSTPKRVLVRAVGPTLVSQGLSSTEVLADPVLQVYSGSTVIASNDNWTDNGNGPAITALSAQVGAATLSANDTTSAALITTLNPGAYTFVVSGQNSTSGIVLIEVYDADSIPSGSLFVNISTRADATTGDGVTIGGFVVAGSKPKQVLVRAVGPTLTTQGIGQSEVLVDPVIQLYSGPSVIATNDNWGDNANAAAIVATGARIGATPFAQTDTTSSALLIKLLPGVYTFIASGKNSTTGVVLVEVYDAD